MNQLILAAAIASLLGGASLARANPEHHAAAETMPMAGGKQAMHRHGHKMPCKPGAEGMRGMSGDHAMMGKDGMNQEQMQRMHDHMSKGGMMGADKMNGGKMGDMAPSAMATPTPPTPK